MTGFRMRFGDPWRALRELQREMNTVFDTTFGREGTAFPPCRIWEGDDDTLVTCEVPGVSMDAIDISVMGDTLTIAGRRKPDEQAGEQEYHRRERFTGEFTRTLTLPARSDSAGVEASAANGVLTVRLPKAAEEKPRRIEIKSA